MTIYPGSTPQFRVLVSRDGAQVLQIRYVHEVHGYKGEWQDVPVVKEEDVDGYRS